MNCREYRMLPASFVWSLHKYYHITPVLCHLHWLPVKYRIIFTILLITLKCYKAYALRTYRISSPAITIVDIARLCCSNASLLRPFTCKTLATLGDSSFQVHAAPKLWNELARFIRDLTPLEAFKESVN